MPRWLGPALVAGSSVLIAVPGVLGWSSLPSLALLGVTTLGALAWLLYALPGALVVLAPACLPSPMMAYTYVWEILLVLLIGVVALHGWVARAAWLRRLSPLEVALLAFTAWGLFSGIWSDDARTYVTQVRRLLLGMGTLWIALRLPHVAPRSWYERGVILATISLSLAALGRFVTSGFTIEEATQHRPEVTQLGWGTANFIATILLLLAPVMIALAGSARGRTRTAAWIAVALAALMQVIISSRAAEVLFVLGTIVQLMATRGRRGFGPALVTVTLLGGLLASPLGQIVTVSRPVSSR